MSVVNVKRRKGESFEGFLRRFTRRLQQSGNMLTARKIRFRQVVPNQNANRASALRRKKVEEKREYLIKIGRLVEDKRRGRRR